MATTKYIKINEIAGKYKEGTLSIHTQSAAPTTAELTMYVASPADLPLVGQKLEVFRRDDVKLFNGNISEVDWVGAVEVGGYLEVKVSAVGKDDILYRRSTWLRLASRCTQFRSFAGNVDTNGSAVTLLDGTPFDKEMEGELIDPPVYTFGNKIKINDVEYPVASVDDPHHLTIIGDAGAQTNVAYTRNITTDMALKYLLDKNCDWEGFTYDESSIAAGSVINGLLLFDPPIPVRDAIGKLLDLDPEFHFTCDVNQKCWYGPRTLAPAPLDFTDATEAFKRGLRVTTTREDVRNIEINITNWDAVLPGDDDTGGIDTFTGDGEKRSWFTSKPIGKAVGCMFNGVEASFSDDVNQDARFYYLPNGSAFWQNPLDPVMASTDSVVFTYKPLAANMLEVIDEDACTLRRTIEGGGLGRYEQPMDRSQFIGKTDAYNSSISSIARNRDNLIRASLRTFDDGYAVGQKVTISIADRGISEDMYIEEVTASDADTAGTVHDFEYTLTCISLERIVLGSESISSLPAEVISSTRRLTGVEILRSLFDIKGMTGGMSIGGSSVVGGGRSDINKLLDSQVPIQEVPFGIRNGINKVFTLSYAPKENPITGLQVLDLYRNGNKLTPFKYNTTGFSSPGGDYSLKEHVVTLKVPPRGPNAEDPIGDILDAVYWPREIHAPSPRESTGAWLAFPQATIVISPGDTAHGEYAFPEPGLVGYEPGPIGCRMQMTWSHSLRDMDSFPIVEMRSLMAPPAVDVRSEWLEARGCVSYVPSADWVEGYPTLSPEYYIHIAPPGRGWSMVGSTHEFANKGGAPGASTKEYIHDDLLASAYINGDPNNYPFGYKDDVQDTLNLGLLASKFYCRMLDSAIVPWDGHTPEPHVTVHQVLMVVYFQAIRINCGGDEVGPFQGRGCPAITDFGEIVPGGYEENMGGSWRGRYKWGKDRLYTGGASKSTGYTWSPGGDPEYYKLFQTARVGQSFKYTIGRNLFADVYPSVRYRLSFFMKDHQYYEVGKRVMDIIVNGVTVLSGIDPRKLATGDQPGFAGTNRASVIVDLPGNRFTGTAEFGGIAIPDLYDGEMEIEIRATVGEALCNAICVEPLAQGGY